MTLRNKIKTTIATLLVGSTLVFGGCPKESKEISNKNPITVQGRVVSENVRSMEVLGRKGPFRIYHIKTNQGKLYGAVMLALRPDPFNLGDCARVELGDKIVTSNHPNDLYFVHPYYVDGKLVNQGYWMERIIVKYSSCKK